MQIHRLLSRPHAAPLPQGAFRFGGLRYYQMLEVVFEDSSIGDAQEGAVSTVVSTTITPDNQGNPLHKNLAESGRISISGNSHVEIRDMNIRHETDCFVCC